MNHDLKIWPEFFDAVASGAKPFDLRKNDRNYHVGDTLLLREWDPNTKEYTGRQMRRLVTYVLQGVGVGGIPPLKGLHHGHVILGLMVWP